MMPVRSWEIVEYEEGALVLADSSWQIDFGRIDGFGLLYMWKEDKVLEERLFMPKRECGGDFSLGQYRATLAKHTAFYYWGHCRQDNGKTEFLFAAAVAHDDINDLKPIEEIGSKPVQAGQ